MSYENIPKNLAGTAVLTEVTNIPIETSASGSMGVAVFLQDQTTEPLDLYFLQTKVTGLTLAAATVANSRNITLTGGHGLTTGNSAGHMLEIARTDKSYFYQGRVISVAGDVVTLDRQVGAVFPTALTLIGTGNSNLVKDSATGVAINGSTTPVIFSLAPLPVQSGDITQITMTSASTNESDLTTFGGAPALTLGVLLRYKRLDGSFKNLANFKTNFDLSIVSAGINTYLPKAGNAARGFDARIRFAGQGNRGVALRLDGALGQELQLVVSELMDATGSGNLTVAFMAQGSELQV